MFIKLPKLFDETFQHVLINTDLISSVAINSVDLDSGITGLEQRSTIYSSGNMQVVQMPFDLLTSVIQLASKGEQRKAENIIFEFEDDYLEEFHPELAYFPKGYIEEENLFLDPEEEENVTSLLSCRDQLEN